MSKNKLTIVVPFYNTDEKLALGFFESLKNQTLIEFDLIIIDDGSSEDKKLFLKHCTNDFINVEIIYNNHSGVSHSRNTGILKTKTDYLAFADSDDILDKDFVKTSIEYIEKYKTDIIYGTIEYGLSSTKIKQSDSLIQYFNNDEIDEVKKSLLDITPRNNSYRILGSPCAKVIKTEIAKKCLFDEDVSMYEDQLFNRRIIDIAKKIVVVPDVWYYYVQHDNSSLHKNLNNSFYNSLVPYLKHSYQLDTEENNTIRNGMRLNYLKILYAAINKDLLAKKYSNKETKEKLLEMINNETIDDTIRNIDINDRNNKLIDKINVLLLRKKIIYPVVIQKKILRLIRNDR